jgi:hypothetical protein
MPSQKQRREARARARCAVPFCTNSEVHRLSGCGHYLCYPCSLGCTRLIRRHNINSFEIKCPLCRLIHKVDSSTVIDALFLTRMETILMSCPSEDCGCLHRVTRVPCRTCPTCPGNLDIVTVSRNYYSDTEDDDISDEMSDDFKSVASDNSFLSAS